MSAAAALSQSSCALQAALTDPRLLSGHDGDRFVGAQVPGENPEHWIAERAPPACS